MRHPWRVLAESSRRPCYSELGFAARHWRGHLLGVTGTNGKTTITSLLCRGLERLGLVALEAGNIGTPLSDRVLSDAHHEDAYAVCEISSFQAELPRGLQLDGLIWSNFSEDHLDRYTSMAEYFAAKASLLRGMRPNASVVIGADVLAFDSRLAEIPNLSVVDQPCALAQSLAPDSPFRMLPQCRNFDLSAALWDALNLPSQALIDSANTFQLAAHRLSPIDYWDGVSYWDDSKATNFHAVWAAINAMQGRVFWIGGGRYKGGNLDAFARLIAPKIEAAFLYGEVAWQLAASLEPIHPRVVIQLDFVDAVQAAVRAALAHAPSTVLLSPGFASFDQFSGYTARGKSFISTVLSLKHALQTS